MAKLGKVSSDISFNPDAPRKAYSDPSVHSKVIEYTAAVKERHGSDYDVSTEPLDTEVLVSLGQGRKHGRLCMADTAVDSSTVPTLSSVRAKSTSSSQPICQRQSRIEALEAELQETKRRSEEQTRHLTEKLEAQNELLESQKAMLES